MSDLYKALTERFPAAAHKSKQGKYTYIPAEDYISRLNANLDLNWSWEITNQHVDLTSPTRAVVVCGVLSYTAPDGNVHRKAGTGAHQDKTGAVEIDMLAKTANTEALKNAAKLMGVCLYLYDEAERTEVEQEMRQPRRAAPKDPAGSATPAAVNRPAAVAPTGPSADGGVVDPREAVLIVAQEAAPDAGDKSLTTAINTLILEWSGGQCNQLSDLTDEQAQKLVGMIAQDGQRLRKHLPTHVRQVDPKRLSECRSCKASIVWMPTRSGKKMPVDAHSFTEGDDVFSKGKHSSHWDTCPNAAEHRQKQEAASA